jgi:hypothetical protein
MRYDRDRIRQVADKCRAAASEDEEYAPVMVAMAELFDGYAELRPLDSKAIDRLTAAVDRLVDLAEETFSTESAGGPVDGSAGVSQ